MNTPWGKTDSVTKIQKGVSWVSTPGHGGFMITRKAAETFLSPEAISRAEAYGQNYLAFEEDCLASLVLWEHSNDVWAETFFNEKDNVQHLFLSISRWNPDYFREKGITPDPAGEAAWLEDKETDRLRKAKSPELIVSAFGDWADWVPAGQVGVITADDQRHLLPADLYPTLGYRLSNYPLSQVIYAGRA